MSKENGKNNFLSHFLVIGSGTVINMLLGLLTTPIITRIVDPNEYGQLSIFNLYSSIALMILCLGLDQALIRFFYSREEQKYKQNLLKFCLKTSLAAGVIVASIFVIILNLRVFRFEFDNLIMYLLCFYIIALICNRFAMLILRITYKSKMFSMCNILQKIVYICVSLGLIAMFKSNYLFILIIATICSIVCPTCVAILGAKEYWQFSFWTSSKLDNKKEIIKYGIPMILAMGITTVFQAIDKISLNLFCTYSEVGIYSSAMTLVNIFAVIQTTFNSLWSPMQVEHYENNSNDRSFYQKGNQMITVVMYFIGINLIMFKGVFVFLLGSKYREAAVILPFLIFNPIMLTISETTCGGIGFSKKSYLNIWVAVGACVTNIIGNMVWVPIWGCKGAAVSTGISYFVFWLLRTVISNKLFYVDYKLKKFFVLTVSVAIYAFYNTFYQSIIFSFIIYIICLLILCTLYHNTIRSLLSIIFREVKKIVTNLKK